jgi:Zn-dependent metalloprotease
MNNKNNVLIILVLLTFSTICLGQSKSFPIPNVVNPFKSKTNQDAINTVSPDGKGSRAYLPQQEVKIKTTKGSFYSNLKKEKVDSKSVGTNINSWFNLNDNHSFQKKSERTDDLGLTHINYQQQYKGIPIDGCVVMTHLKDGETKSVNGQVAEFSAIDINSTITPERAEELSKEYLKVTNLLNTYPIELLIARIPIADSVNYILAYKVRIDASQPFLMRNVYVNAKTGSIIKVVNLIASGDITGTANTYYRGNQSITFDSYLTAYRLRESARKIETYNAANATFTAGTGFAGYSDFVNTTTTWTGVPQLSSFSISSVAQNWWYSVFADELPDLYIKVKDGANQTVYTSGYINNTNPPVTDRKSVV